VNNRNRNFTRAKIKHRLKQIDDSIKRYLGQIASADRIDRSRAKVKKEGLNEKIAKLKQEVEHLNQTEQELEESTDGQVSLTDPEARSMATSGRGSGLVGYNVQAAVDSKHHLILAHEVTNQGHDRAQLANMATQAQAVLETQEITVVADRGYYSGEEIKSWMGSTHFQMKAIKRVSAEMSLHVLAYNLKRVIKILGTKQLIEAIQT